MILNIGGNARGNTGNINKNSDLNDKDFAI